MQYFNIEEPRNQDGYPFTSMFNNLNYIKILIVNMIAIDFYCLYVFKYLFINVLFDFYLKNIDIYWYLFFGFDSNVV
jgi:hypothetical protein